MTHAEQVARDERALADAALAFLAAECSHGPERKALELAGARVRAGREATCERCDGRGWTEIAGRSGYAPPVVCPANCDNGRKR